MRIAELARRSEPEKVKVALVNNREWMNKVDFAWVGSDQRGRVALFYANSGPYPSVVLETYTESKYQEITNFIIEDLPEAGRANVLREWAFALESRAGSDVGLTKKKANHCCSMDSAWASCDAPAR